MRDAVLVALVPGTGDLPERLTEQAPSQQRRRQTDEAVGRAVAAIVDPDVAARPDDETAHAAQRVLEGVVGHAAACRQAPALTLLALLTWWRGGGARAGALLERALGCDPSYPLALLVRQALEAGIPPGWVRTDGARDARD